MPVTSRRALGTRKKALSPEQETVRGVALAWATRVSKLKPWAGRVDDVRVMVSYSNASLRAGCAVETWPFTRKIVVRVNERAKIEDVVTELLHAFAHCSCSPWRERHDLEWKDNLALAAWELTGESLYSYCSAPNLLVNVCGVVKRMLEREKA
jgi:hypothetical protein